jgi:ribosomal protein S18 acetylase RimI-like enzyme
MLSIVPAENCGTLENSPMASLNMKAYESMEEAAPLTIRTVQQQDLAFLWEMLYEAVAVAESMRALGKEKALTLPVNRKYLEGWGRPGDAGVIALDQAEQPLGAAWYRLYPAEAPGYGFVAATIPELSIGVRDEVRGRGIGGALLQALIELAHSQGYTILSLSVDRANPARHLYERYGFRDAGISGPEDMSVTMIRE